MDHKQHSGGNGHAADQHKHEQHQPHEQKVNGQREHELVAHFADQQHVLHAARAIAERGLSTHVAELHEPTKPTIMMQPTDASMGLTTVEFGGSMWIGLVAGAILGGIVGWLVFSGRLLLPGVASTLGAGPLAVIVLGAGIVGAVGAFIGAAIHLFRTPNETMHELHVTITEGVPDDQQIEIGQALVDHGAIDVFMVEHQHAHDAAPYEEAIHSH